MTERFYKGYYKEINFEEKDKELTPHQKKVNEVKRDGATFLWEYLITHNVARRGWVDTEDYQMKKRYYDKGFLACTFSRRKLEKDLDIGKKKLEKWIQLLVEAEWIRLDNKVKNGQRVFIIGTWKEVNEKYSEELFRFADLDVELTEKEKQIDWIQRQDPIFLLELRA